MTAVGSSEAVGDTSILHGTTLQKTKFWTTSE